MTRAGYSPHEISGALKDVGIKHGDTIYVSTQLFGLGPMAGAPNRSKYLEGFHAGLRGAVGPEGTIVVPAFTQQVGRFGLPYVHEQTPCLTGIYSEFLRMRPEALRSLHPVFSVVAEGPEAEGITRDVSSVAFGRNSAFDRIYRGGGKALCFGFQYYSGHITSLMHYAETSFAVPYYYNKLVLADVFSEGQQVHRPFVINVKYPGIGCQFDYRRYIDALATRSEIHAAPIGSGMVYSVDVVRQIDIGIDLLSADVYAFLKHPPQYQHGRIPTDGPPEAHPKGATPSNWIGMLIGAGD